MIEISIEKANKIRISYYNNSSNVKSIEMSYRDNFVYMTVSRITGITEYKIIPEPKKDNKSIIKIREYTDSYTVVTNNKTYHFNGLSEPDKLLELLKELGVEAEYEEIARDVVLRGNQII